MRWYVYDGLGSVLAEVDEYGVVNPDSQGNPTPLRKYDVYGGIRNTQAVAPGTSDHKFVGSLGHTSEAETGLIYMRARYMDPALGRFISEDPARDGRNWFLYVGNNPVNFTDSTGLFLDLLLAALEEFGTKSKECAQAQLVKRWGTDRIMSAVSQHSGLISGYLAAGELTSMAIPNGIVIKNLTNGRQIFMHIGPDYHGGILHIDFQPDVVGGAKYARIYFRAFVKGFGEGMGF